MHKQNFRGMKSYQVFYLTAMFCTLICLSGERPLKKKKTDSFAEQSSCPGEIP